MAKTEYLNGARKTERINEKVENENFDRAQRKGMKIAKDRKQRKKERKKERRTRSTKKYRNCDQLHQWRVLRRMIEYTSDENTRSCCLYLIGELDGLLML